MIKTVIFDIGNVLAGFSWKAFFESKGYSEEMVERLAAATTCNKDWHEVDRGFLSNEELIDLLAENDREIEQEIRTVFADMRGIISRYDYAIPWIKALKASGYQVLVLSNFGEKALQECWHELDFLPYLDGGILSYRDKVLKPNPEIYHLLLYRYHLKAAECVFIDDLQANIDGARAVGMHGICFQSRQQAVKELEALGVVCEDFS